MIYYIILIILSNLYRFKLWYLWYSTIYYMFLKCLFLRPKEIKAQ